MEPTRGYCCHAKRKARENGWEKRSRQGQRLTSDEDGLVNGEEMEREQAVQEYTNRHHWNSGMGF